MILNARHLIRLRKSSCWPKVYAFVLQWISPWSNLNRKVSILLFTHLKEGGKATQDFQRRPFFIQGLIRCPLTTTLIFYIICGWGERAQLHRIKMKIQCKHQLTYFMVFFSFFFFFLAAKLYLDMTKLGLAFKQAGCRLWQNNHSTHLTKKLNL